MNEEWRKIKGYEGYQVSNLGRVKSISRLCGGNQKHKGRLLSQENVKGGYKRVTLSNNNIQTRIQVHRLVALMFLVNNENKPCVNHINGIKDDNNVSNLEWCTYSENEIHSYNKLGKINNNRKLTDEEVIYIRSNLVKGPKGNTKLFMVKYNLNRKTILNAFNCKYYVNS